MSDEYKCLSECCRLRDPLKSGCRFYSAIPRLSEPSEIALQLHKALDSNPGSTMGVAVCHFEENGK